MENLQKVLKIKSQQKIDIPCQKGHKSRLKLRCWDPTPTPIWGWGWGENPPKRPFWQLPGDFAGPREFTGQNECRHRLLHKKKIFKNPSFHHVGRKSSYFCGAVLSIILAGRKKLACNEKMDFRRNFFRSVRHIYRCFLRIILPTVGLNRGSGGVRVSPSKYLYFNLFFGYFSSF